MTNEQTKQGFFQRLRHAITEATSLGNYIRASIDARRYRRIAREIARKGAKAGSMATPYPKRGNQPRPFKRIAGESMVRVKVKGAKKKTEVRRMWCATDSTPNRYEFARLTDNRRNPSARKLRDHELRYS